jgi:hypothetical protein
MQAPRTSQAYPLSRWMELALDVLIPAVAALLTAGVFLLVLR